MASRIATPTKWPPTAWTAFSVWGWFALPEAAQAGAALIVAAAAVLAAFRPRERDVVMVAALASALLLAQQLVADHWFYTYVVWFLPPFLLALLGPYEIGRSTDSIDAARRRPAQRTSTALIHGSSSAAS